MKLNYDLISEYERYNLTANEEDEKIIINDIYKQNSSMWCVWI